MSSASLTHATGSERIALWTSSSCSYLDQDPREASSLARLFQPYEWCHAIRQRRGQAPDACRPVLQISAEPLRPMPFDWLSLSPQSAVSVSAPVPTGSRFVQSENGFLLKKREGEPEAATGNLRNTKNQLARNLANRSTTERTAPTTRSPKKSAFFTDSLLGKQCMHGRFSPACKSGENPCPSEKRIYARRASYRMCLICFAFWAFTAPYTVPRESREEITVRK